MAARPSLMALAAIVAAAMARAGDGPPEPAYPHKSVTKREIGAGPRSYSLFEPAEPTPKRAPVVVFHHGWLAMNPGVYGAWIEHLVRSGHIVIYPRYMDVDTPVPEYLPNAIAGIVDALGVLEMSPAHVKPDRSRFALVGHSTGGVLSVQMAALAKSEGLPEPRAVVAVTPGEVLRTKGPGLADVPASPSWRSSPPSTTSSPATATPGASTARRPPSPPRARNTSSTGPTSAADRGSGPTTWPRPPRTPTSTPATARSASSR